MGHVTYCLMCLGTDMKMYHMNSSMLKIYNEFILTACKLNVNYMSACYECAYLLYKYAKFKLKCCTAYNILWNLSPGSFVVTEEDLKQIDRKENKLESLLTVYTSTAYCTPNREYSLSFPKIGVYNIKRESSLNIIHEQCNKNITASKIDKDEVSQSINTLELESSSMSSNEENDNGLSVKIIRQDLGLENIGICNNKLDFACPIESDGDCIERSPDIKADTIHNIENVTIARKRKYEKQNDNIVQSNDNVKINNGNNVLRSVDIVNDMNTKSNTKNKSERDKNPKGLLKNKKDCRLTLDSSFFRDHVTIIKLTPEDATCELLLRKESNNYKMNLHKCEQCYRGFISEATYDAHMKKHSLDYGTIKCDICQLSFNDNRSLSRHWSMCHTWKLLCKTCPYMCFNINQAKSHIQSHKGKKYTCKDCGESFRFPNSLSTHMRLKHSIELVCEFCGSTFASVQGMDCHKRLRHRKQENSRAGPQCVECDVHFASELAWKRHRVLCSRHHVSNGCGVCGESFPNRVELRNHAREHGEPSTTAHSRSRKLVEYKPTPCQFCNKELHSRKAYVKHMDSEHPQMDTDKRLTSRCVCEICGRTFKHRSFLIAHQRKHTDEKPFSCPHCGKKFKNAYAVKMHLPMHTNEYTFKCHLCDKAFGDRGRLNRHVKSHLGIRPYKCSYCERTFMFQCEERLHTKYVHCKEPYPKRERSKRNTVKKGDVK